jgi:serine/threonine protein kinase
VADGRRDCLTQEPVAGELLSERLARGSLAPDEALHFGIQLGLVLHQVHTAGKVHGGLCPLRIAITAEGLRLLDAPLAPGDRAAYRSPEEIRGQAADQRSDIFAYGALLYELAAGKRAFPGTGQELDESILAREPVGLMPQSPVHAAMEGVIAGCLKKDPAWRRQRVHNAVDRTQAGGPFHGARGGDRGP